MSGYERLAGLMAKHTEVSTFHRFDFLNTLNLLYLQAELLHIEDELRASMKEDVESANLPLPEASSVRSVPVSLSAPEEGIESSRHAGLSEADKNIEMSPISRFETVPELESEINGRFEGSRDWYYLARTDDSPTWRIMLRAREKLNEYNEALSRQIELKSQDSPNACDLDFLRRWFKGKNMGNFPLIGLDSTLWESTEASDLIALKSRKGDDPLSSIFLSKVYLWWHDCIGHRIKRPCDEESQYFKYSDKGVLRAANIVGSVLSSGLLVGSILALYFVDSVLVRLGIIAAFTQVFSLVLILVTSAKKVEVFAATAAFVAVQVVFVGSTYTPASGPPE